MPSSSTRNSTIDSSVASTPSSIVPPSGEYLIPFSTRLTRICRTRSLSAATDGTPSPTATASVMCVGVRAELRHALEELGRLERLGHEVEPPDVELVGEQDLVHDPAEALGLVDDQRDEPRAPPRRARSRGVAASALRRRQRAESGLVGRSRDELGLQLVEAVRLGDVTERVDGAGEELDA